MRNYTEDAPEIIEPLPYLAPMNQETLLDLLDISETTVRLNRAGKLTSDQQTFVRSQMKGDDDSLWLLSTIFIGTALLLALIFLTQALGMTPLILGGGVFFGAFGLFSFFRRQRYQRDLAVRVGKATGDLHVVRSNSFSQWALVINDRFFPISETLADKFEGYEPPFVAAYYTEGTNTLLSLEILSPQKRKNDQLTAHAEDEDAVQAPLASWDKPKNNLEDPSTSARDVEPEITEQDSAANSKRRF